VTEHRPVNEMTDHAYHLCHLLALDFIESLCNQTFVDIQLRKVNAFDHDRRSWFLPTFVTVSFSYTAVAASTFHLSCLGIIHESLLS
jgi:hypothetical protein